LAVGAASVAVSLVARRRGFLPEAHGLFARRPRRIGVGVEDCRNVVEDFFKPADPRKPLLDGEIEPAVVGKFALVEQHCSGGAGAFFQTAIAVRLDNGVRDDVQILQNVNAEHPPDQKYGDDGDYKIANPLAGGSRFRAVIHGLIVAGWGQ